MKIPRWTLLTCGIATVVYLVPWLSNALIYDRESIQGGEWWRIVTGNLVHLSGRHFIFDVFALLVIGSIIEQRSARYLWLFYLISGVVVGLVVLITSPELQFFGGLSGIVTAALIYLCVDGIRDQGAWRWMCLSILILVMIKIGIEFVLGVSILSATESQPFISVPASHLAGFCTALFVYVLTTIKSIPRQNK
jgi:rhomboid family GlyGly-CTERM serine protease